MGSEAPYDSERLVDALIEANVLTSDDRSGGVRFTTEFSDVLDERTSFVDNSTESAISEEINSISGNENETSALLELGEDDSRIIAEYLALDAFDCLSHVDRLRALTTFDSFYSPPPRSEGSPQSFLPVCGDRLPFLFEMYDRAIVYIWREDCPPCDIVKTDLEEIFPEPPDDIALLSVYGPESGELLAEKYSVTGGPTTLFIRDGRIDFRLYSAPSRDLLERECQRHRELATE